MGGRDLAGAEEGKAQESGYQRPALPPTRSAARESRVLPLSQVPELSSQDWVKASALGPTPGLRATVDLMTSKERQYFCFS